MLTLFLSQLCVAGCIAVATDGICMIPNVAVLKKDQKEKLQNGRHEDSVTIQNGNIMLLARMSIC